MLRFYGESGFAKRGSSLSTSHSSSGTRKEGGVVPARWRNGLIRKVVNHHMAIFELTLTLQSAIKPGGQEFSNDYADYADYFHKLRSLFCTSRNLPPVTDDACPQCTQQRAIRIGSHHGTLLYKRALSAQAPP